MDIGVNMPVVNPEATPAFLREIAQRAKELGFAELYLGEHVVLFDEPRDEYHQSDDGTAFFASMANLPDPIQTLTHFAACTEHIRLATGVALIPKPLQQPHPPLWFGGFGEATYQRVADLGAGYYGFDQTPAEIATVRARIGELLDERGRSIDEITISHGVYNRLPVSVELLGEYHAAGVDQFVVSLVGPSAHDMREQLSWFGREYVGRY